MICYHIKLTSVEYLCEKKFCIRKKIVVFRDCKSYYRYVNLLFISLLSYKRAFDGHVRLILKEQAHVRLTEC